MANINKIKIPQLYIFKNVLSAYLVKFILPHPTPPFYFEIVNKRVCFGLVLVHVFSEHLAHSQARAKKKTVIWLT